MFPSNPLAIAPKKQSADERRLGKLFRALNAQQQQTLLSFAEFLSERSTGSSGELDGQSDGDPGNGSGAASDAAAAPLATPRLPQFELRPPEESVVAAIKRLRRIYPMLDNSALLGDTSSLMAAHVMKGREASAVIDELEALFAERFEMHHNSKN